MQWVAKRHYILGAAIVVALCSFFTIVGTVVLSVQSTSKVDAPLVVCFDTSTATTSHTSGECAANLLSLGSGPLIATPDSQGAVSVLHPTLALRFAAAQFAAAQEGVHLYISSGYRTESRQMYLYKREIEARGSETEAARWVLPPWYSHHPQGLALDINYPLDRPGAQWLEKNGWRFGLCRVYRNEWWHFEGSNTPGEPCPVLIPDAISTIPPSSLKLRSDK